MDRLLRYEASLERAFDRNLNQLERLQKDAEGTSGAGADQRQSLGFVIDPEAYFDKA